MTLNKLPIPSYYLLENGRKLGRTWRTGHYYKSNGYQASTWRTNTPNLTSNSNRIYFVMYGGPRRPNFSPFQGRSRAPSWNFRPRFESPGFPSPGHNVYPPLGQPFQPSQRPYGFMDNPGPQGVRTGFQSGAWQVAGPRQGFRTGGYREQQRPQRVNAVFGSFCLSGLCTYQCQAGGRMRGIGRGFDRSLWPGGKAFELSCCPRGRDI